MTSTNRPAAGARKGRNLRQQKRRKHLPKVSKSQMPCLEKAFLRVDFTRKIIGSLLDSVRRTRIRSDPVPRSAHRVNQSLRRVQVNFLAQIFLFASGQAQGWPIGDGNSSGVPGTRGVSNLQH